MNVQVFGIRKSAATRDALRFFAERRIPVHFADLTVRPASAGELRRYVQAFGIPALVDASSARYRDLGLGVSLRSDDWWLTRLVEDPLLLRMPLVRSGKQLSVGPATEQWKQWVAVARRGTG